MDFSVRVAYNCGMVAPGRIAGLCFSVAVVVSPTVVADDRDRGLMPMPAEIEFGPGAMRLEEQLAVVLPDYTDSRLDRAVNRFVAHLRTYIGMFVTRVTPNDAKAAQLLIRCRGPGQSVQSYDENDSYTLSVTTRVATLEAETPIGVLRGLATLEQLVQPGGDGFIIPEVRISDRARFPWRGLLIDVCRHWQPMEVIKRNLDAMAAVKLNVLHLHLTEDQGFRIESKRFPELHRRGSDGDYFTQQELREIVAYARDRGIRVVPEFDMPGHTTSWLVGHPELAAGPGPFRIERKWGVFDPCFDPTKDSLYTFLDAFFFDMIHIFPDDFVHIGGDEVNGNLWNANPKIQSFMYDNDLTDNHALQGYFNRRVALILARYGNRMIGWDEILRSNIPSECVIQSWRGMETLREAARMGFNTILSNGYYLDHQLSAAQHYQNDPGKAGETLTEVERRRILGGEACMWGEYVSPETVDSRIWPRLAAIAERLWSPASINDVDDMYRRLDNVSEQLTHVGVRHQSNYKRMLRRLAGVHPTEPVRVLADVVEPVKFYGRSAARRYTSQTPLNRLVDTARPESRAAREFRANVDRFISDPDARRRERDAIRRSLVTWRDNYDALLPVIRDSELLAEVEPVARHLKRVADAGLASLDLFEANRRPEPTWRAQADQVLDAAAKPIAEVEIAVVSAVRQLVDAACKLD